MADLDAAVLDTHALIFHAEGSGKLGPRAAAFLDRCENRQAIAYVPAIVICECSLLARISRIRLNRSVRLFFDDLFSNPAFQPLDLIPEHVYLAGDLTFTRDPFDALICASAQALGVPIITRDAQIRGSGVVEVIW